ncbi:hypothetical protein V5O48_010562 [Marasmius crinis-equi]|uniref:Uncharacterized protein n=1 Tax=Marasmius crinis-equi TaxID=585013 RepID=A0ABR3F827_9AGAR
MTSVAPPPYVGNGAALVDTKSLTAGVAALTPEKKNDVVGILNNPDNQKLIKENIDNLCEQTQNTRKAFEDISILLDQFDSHKFKNKENNDIEPLRPNWEALRTRYNALLSKSKTDANHIKVLCDDYKVNILSLLDDDCLDMKMKEVRVELQGYIKRSENGAKAAGENVDSFENLRVDVRLAKSRIDAAFGAASADPTNRAPTLREEIKTLKGQIAEAQKYASCFSTIDDCLKALKIAGVVSGVGALLTAFCPFAGILVAGAAFAAAGAKIAADKKQKELTSLTESLATKEQELAIIEEREKILADLRVQLKNDEASFDTITNQLTALSTFWQAVKEELNGIISHLNNAVSEDTTMRASQLVTVQLQTVANSHLQTFRKTLGEKLTGTIYQTLGDTLGKYIAQMGKLEEKKQ